MQPSLPFELRPDRHAHAAVDRLCVMGGCSRRRETTVTVRLGGRDRTIAVCVPHGRRVAA